MTSKQKLSATQASFMEAAREAGHVGVYSPFGFGESEAAITAWHHVAESLVCLGLGTMQHNGISTRFVVSDLPTIEITPENVGGMVARHQAGRPVLYRECLFADLIASAVRHKCEKARAELTSRGIDWPRYA